MTAADSGSASRRDMPLSPPFPSLSALPPSSSSSSHLCASSSSSYLRELADRSLSPPHAFSLNSLPKPSTMSSLAENSSSIDEDAHQGKKRKSGSAELEEEVSGKHGKKPKAGNLDEEILCDLDQLGTAFEETFGDIASVDADDIGGDDLHSDLVNSAILAGPEQPVQEYDRTVARAAILQAMSDHGISDVNTTSLLNVSSRCPTNAEVLAAASAFLESSGARQIAERLGIRPESLILRNFTLANTFADIAKSILHGEALVADTKATFFEQSIGNVFTTNRVSSNWATHEDVLQMHLMANHNYRTASEASKQAILSGHVTGDFLGQVPSSTTTALKLSGLDGSLNDNVGFKDQSFYLFPTRLSGSKPQQKYGDKFMRRFEFVLAMEYFVWVSLGGKWDLVLSDEASQDTDKALDLLAGAGIFELHKWKYNFFGRDVVHTTILPGSVGALASVIHSFAPTIGIYKETPPTQKASLDRAILFFRTVLPEEFTGSVELSQANAVSETVPSFKRRNFTLGVVRWVPWIKTLAMEHLRHDSLTEDFLYEQDPIFFAQLCAYVDLRQAIIQDTYAQERKAGWSIGHIVCKLLGDRTATTKSYLHLLQQYIQSGQDIDSDSIPSHIQEAVDHLSGSQRYKAARSLHPDKSDLEFVLAMVVRALPTTVAALRALEEKHYKEWCAILQMQEPIVDPDSLAALNAYASQCPLVAAGSADKPLKLLKDVVDVINSKQRSRATNLRRREVAKDREGRDFTAQESAKEEAVVRPHNTCYVCSRRIDPLRHLVFFEKKVCADCYIRGEKEKRIPEMLKAFMGKNAKNHFSF